MKQFFIEISQQAANIFSVLGENVIFDSNFMSVEKYVIKTPNTLIHVKDADYKIFLPHIGNEQKTRKLINDFQESQVKITIEKKGEETSFEVEFLKGVKSEYWFTLCQFTLSESCYRDTTFKFPTILGNFNPSSNFKDNLCFTVITLAWNCLFYLKQPDSDFEESSSKQIISNKKSKKIKYGYVTTYKINNATLDDYKKAVRYAISETIEPIEEKSVSQELPKMRKGHYRHYKDKETGEIIKSVWIEPSPIKDKKSTQRAN